jgi:hypothetical protein
VGQRPRQPRGPGKGCCRHGEILHQILPVEADILLGPVGIELLSMVNRIRFYRNVYPGIRIQPGNDDEISQRSACQCCDELLHLTKATRKDWLCHAFPSQLEDQSADWLIFQTDPSPYETSKRQPRRISSQRIAVVPPPTCDRPQKKTRRCASRSWPNTSGDDSYRFRYSS